MHLIYFEKINMQAINILPTDKILILAPHPDDESIWCWGILAQHWPQCDVIILTDWRHWWLDNQSFEDTVKVRQNETIHASHIAKINKTSFLWIEDWKLQENLNQLLNIKFSDYDTVLCPAPWDNHPDHSCVFEFLEKQRLGAQIYWYEIRSTIGQPTHHFDMSEVVDIKRSLIDCHQSQIQQVNYTSKIIWLNQYRGMMVYPAIEFAECYIKLL